VVRVSLENYPDIKGKFKKILFLGDMLIDFGDFLYCNKALPPSGYVEEWWQKTFKGHYGKFGSDFQKAAQATNLPIVKLEDFVADPFACKPTVKKAAALSLP